MVHHCMSDHKCRVPLHCQRNSPYRNWRGAMFISTWVMFSVIVCHGPCKDKKHGHSLAGIGLSLQMQPPSVGCAHSVHSQTFQHKSQQKLLWVMQMHHNIISPHTLISGLFFLINYILKHRREFAKALLSMQLRKVPHADRNINMEILLNY